MDGPVERRLIAVLAADIVGYSRLMGVDEEGTHYCYKALRRELIDPNVAAHCGRIVKSTGDGFLAEFPIVVEAVVCAVELQRALAERNAKELPARRMDFRIGINLGDVIIESDDIYGDGVNIAARLEGVAEPGGICISDAVRVAAGNKVPVDYESMGDQSLKNIVEPIRVYRVRSRPGVPMPHPSAAPRSVGPMMTGLHQQISVSRMPVTGRLLLGREEELRQLEQAWATPHCNIVSLVAWGGVGKSTLINHWVRRMAQDGYRGADRVYAWSFYHQGTIDRVTAADEFIEASLTWFGDTDPNKGSAREKGERLAKHVQQRRALLILDGLEPLQRPRARRKVPSRTMVSMLSSANLLPSILAYASLQRVCRSLICRIFNTPIARSTSVVSRLGTVRNSCAHITLREASTTWNRRVRNLADIVWH